MKIKMFENVMQIKLNLNYDELKEAQELCGSIVIDNFMFYAVDETESTSLTSFGVGLRPSQTDGKCTITLMLPERGSIKEIFTSLEKIRTNEDKLIVKVQDILNNYKTLLDDIVKLD